MDRYQFFKYLLSAMADKTEITGANMKDYCGCIQIVGETSDQVITLTVSFKDKEDDQDGN